MSSFLRNFPLWLAIASLISPLSGQAVSELELEKSSNLDVWESVTITPEMISGSGKLLVPTSGSQQFYRMKLRLLQAPSISSPPPATTGIEEGGSVIFTVQAQGEGLTYQWYLGQSGDTSQPIQGATSQTYDTRALVADTSYWVKVTNDAGSSNSETVTVTINRPPTITSQPASTSVETGSAATLTVSATGSAPFTYQWYRGNVGATTSPVGTNSPTFITPSLTVTTKYWVKITNSFGEANSNSVTVTVATAPSITTQPASTTITSGSTATLTVTTTGTAPPTYQWYQGVVGVTTNPVGTNSTSFTTPALTATTMYWVRITNAAGSVDSALATVTVGSSTPADLAFIPAGSFTMGDNLDGASDAPVVTVTVSAFYMGRNEVTKALWDEVRTWALANGYTGLATGGGKASNHPVHTVSWWEVVKWCNARSQKEGLTPCYTVGGAVMKTGGGTAPTVNWSANGYRLPTEAEWEKAARGGLSGKRFPWGDTISHSQANYFASSGYSYDLSGAVNNYHPAYATGSYPYTSPVASFAANGYGLNDMVGNVKEWCWDWYGSSTYVTGATDPRGAASGTRRVIRDGAWVDAATDCRVAARTGIYDPAGNGSVLGFRVARSTIP
jgi:formylglycine-generating enzyme